MRHGNSQYITLIVFDVCGAPVLLAVFLDSTYEASNTAYRRSVAYKANIRLRFIVLPSFALLITVVAVISWLL